MQTRPIPSTDWAAMEEQQKEMERGRARNVELLTKMWLTLGPDVLKLSGTAHDMELSEARGIAISKWEQLLSLEQQIPRDEANLAVLERGRIAEPTDEYAPKELLAKKDADHRARIESRRASIRDMKDQAKRDRKALEALIVRGR
jgi:hypothetical protein